MRAAVFERPGEVAIVECEAPEPGRGEVRVRVRRCGVCGTDVHIHRGDYELARYPLIPGHELVGTIDALGEGVVGLAVGERVVVDPNLSCEACAFCRRGEHNHCVNWQGIGITRAGGFAEFVTAPIEAVYGVPGAIDDAAAALVEPLACVVHGLNRLPIRAGDAALLTGVGPMGLLLVQALRHRGVGELIAVDLKGERLDAAAALGATAAWLVDDALEGKLRRRAPRGFDVIVDASGAKSAIELALRHLRPRGRYLQFGVASPDTTIELRPFDLFKHDWHLLGSFALSRTFAQAIDWLAAGVIDARPVVSDTVGLEELEPMLRAFAAGRTMKVQVAL